jgi:hypothetical protein
LNARRQVGPQLPVHSGQARRCLARHQKRGEKGQRDREREREREGGRGRGKVGKSG